VIHPPTTTGGQVVLCVLGVLLGYLLGSVNPAAIIARVRGADLRGTGSGNPGATNAARAMGWQVGVLVGLIDVLKGFVPAFVFGQALPQAGYLAGLAAVVGHITSPWLKGRGGKGVATALGAILGTTWVWAVPVLLAFAVVVVLTRRVGLGAVAGCLTLIPSALVWHPLPGGIFFAVAMSALVVWRHRSNLVAAYQASRERLGVDPGPPGPPGPPGG
jgi:glycerol-3-phosphate acyltransferase PlsY